MIGLEEFSNLVQTIAWNPFVLRVQRYGGLTVIKSTGLCLFCFSASYDENSEGDLVCWVSVTIASHKGGG